MEQLGAVKTMNQSIAEQLAEIEVIQRAQREAIEKKRDDERRRLAGPQGPQQQRWTACIYCRREVFRQSAFCSAECERSWNSMGQAHVYVSDPHDRKYQRDTRDLCDYFRSSRAGRHFGTAWWLRFPEGWETEERDGGWARGWKRKWLGLRCFEVIPM